MTPFIEALVLAGDGTTWLHLVDPVAIVHADRSDHVQTALRDAREEAGRRGLHAGVAHQGRRVRTPRDDDGIAGTGVGRDHI